MNFFLHDNCVIVCAIVYFYKYISVLVYKLQIIILFCLKYAEGQNICNQDKFPFVWINKEILSYIIICINMNI